MNKVIFVKEDFDGAKNIGIPVKELISFQIYIYIYIHIQIYIHIIYKYIYTHYI